MRDVGFQSDLLQVGAITEVKSLNHRYTFERVWLGTSKATATLYRRRET
jgi:hypothetical protein